MFKNKSLPIPYWISQTLTVMTILTATIKFHSKLRSHQIVQQRDVNLFTGCTVDELVGLISDKKSGLLHSSDMPRYAIQECAPFI